MTPRTIVRKAKQTYNQRVTDYYEDTYTLTDEDCKCIEEEICNDTPFDKHSAEEQEEIIKDYVSEDWELTNKVRSEDEGWADDPCEDYEDTIEIVKETS